MDHIFRPLMWRRYPPPLAQSSFGTVKAAYPVQWKLSSGFLHLAGWILHHHPLGDTELTHVWAGLIP